MRKAIEILTLGVKSSNCCFLIRYFTNQLRWLSLLFFTVYLSVLLIFAVGNLQEQPSSSSKGDEKLLQKPWAS